MQEFINIIYTIIPIFMIIVVGWFAGFTKLIEAKTGAKALINFVLYITLPSMIFLRTAQSKIDNLSNVKFIIAYSICVLSTYFFVLFYDLIFYKNKSKTQHHIRAFVSCFSNIGIFGIPFLTLSIGEKIITPIVVGMLINNLVIVPIVTTCVEGDKYQVSNKAKVFFKSFGKAVMHPMILAPFLGIFLSFFNIKINESIYSFFSLIAKPTSGTALFAIGLIIYSEKAKLNLEVLVNVFFKLLVQPIFAIILILVFDLKGIWALATLYLSMLPPGVVPVMYSVRYKGYQKNATSTMFYGTIFSFITLIIFIELSINFL